MKQKNTSRLFLGILTVCALSFFLTSTIGCSDETTPTPPSSEYYVTYTWSGEGDYRITYWFQSESQQYLSSNSGNDTSQGTYSSPTFTHPNNEDLSIKTAIEFSDSQCADVQLRLFRDSVEVMVKDYVMGDPGNIVCTADNFRQEVYTP
tara:strand:- start:285 stop:731 length:447 start_codon:yes stop_codon:yes gene_type:complete